MTLTPNFAKMRIIYDINIADLTTLYKYTSSLAPTQVDLNCVTKVKIYNCWSRRAQTDSVETRYALKTCSSELESDETGRQL